MAEPLSDLFSPQTLADPYPAYDRLRSVDPVHWHEGLGVWIFTRYTDIVAALRDPRFGAERMFGTAEEIRAWGLENLTPLLNALADMMLFSDPPKHTRLRGLVSKAFTPRVVESMRASIQQVVDGLLDAVQDTGRMDVLSDLACPLPTTVIAQMLGVPEHERARFKKWSDDFAAFIGNFYTTPEQQQEALNSLFGMREYFQRVVAQLRKHPKDDLLSALVMAEEQGDRLGPDELLANAILLLAAGHETTTNLIGNGLLALLRHPDQLRRLRSNPTLIERAVEELLRYDSPVQFTGRRAKANLEVDGKHIAKEQFVVLVLGSANRDPAQFVEPHRLDIDREENKHLAFGHGPHFCLGAPLARLEGQIAISTVLARMPALRLETEAVTWRENFSLRGLTSLPLAF